MELIGGVLVAGLVQWLKNKYKTSEYGTLGIVALLSVLAAGAYTLLSAYGYWDTLYQVIVTAGAVYVYLLKRFEGATPTISSGV